MITPISCSDSSIFALALSNLNLISIVHTVCASCGGTPFFGRSPVDFVYDGVVGVDVIYVDRMGFWRDTDVFVREHSTSFVAIASTSMTTISTRRRRWPSSTIICRIRSSVGGSRASVTRFSRWSGTRANARCCSEGSGTHAGASNPRTTSRRGRPSNRCSVCCSGTTSSEMGRVTRPLFFYFDD